jgi:hypothetical protein
LGSVPVRACSLPQYDYVLVLVNDYFQYDYILVHVNDYFQYNYVHVNDYFPKAVRGTALHQLVTATTLYGYIEQGPSTINISNPRDNGAPVDSVNRSAFGYILNLMCVFLLFKFYLSFNLNTSTCFALTGSLITVMNLLIISGIKMYRKLPNCLTTILFTLLVMVPCTLIPLVSMQKLKKILIKMMEFWSKTVPPLYPMCPFPFW